MTKSEFEAIIATACKNAAAEAVAAYIKENGKQQAAPEKSAKQSKPELWLLPTRRENDKLNGIELVFDGKPVQAIRTFLLSNGMHWNGKAEGQPWWIKRNEVNQAIVSNICDKLQQAMNLPEGKRDEFLNGKKQNAAPAPAAAAPAPVVNRIPKDAPKEQASNGALAVGQCFIIDRDFPGEEKVFKIVSFPADDKVKVKDRDGKTAVHKLQRTEYGTYYITVNKRRAPLC